MVPIDRKYRFGPIRLGRLVGLVRLVGLAWLIGVALVAAGCSGSGDGDPESVPGTADSPDRDASDGDASDADSPDSDASDGEASDGAAAGGFTGQVRGSAEQVVVTGAEPGQTLTLVGGDESVTGQVDELGNLIFRDVTAGEDYRVVAESGAAETVAVLALDDHPDDAFYASQTLEPGFGYVETRDGTLLSVMVRLPGPVAEGPYPTVVEYSGYSPSDPDEPQPAMGLAAQLGYATVGVNLRGTGCSGGAFDFFEPLQSLDGYDAIEVISRQPWVAGGQVGMVGLSYPGITQLFVARYQPPGLKAITPMSVIEDTYRSTLFPGGIANVGFAKTWAEARQTEAMPLGAEFARDLVDAGDEVCDSNQLLRSQSVDLEVEAKDAAFYDPDRSDRLAPRTFVDQIDVPVFLSGQWQDEQTGGRFATMLDRFTGTDTLRIHLSNGAHADGFGPTVLLRWAEFLDFYVAERVPDVAAGLRLLIPAGYAQSYGVAMSLPADRFDEFRTVEELDGESEASGRAAFEAALDAYEAEPPVLVLLESGSDPSALGGPTPRSTVTFDTWPPTEARDMSWFLSAEPASGAPLVGESLALLATTVTPVMDPAPAYEPDPSEGAVLMVPRPGSIGFADLDWPHPRSGSSLSWTSEPLGTDMLLAGTGRVELTIETIAADVDVEVTISEVRPDGTEVYVQSGWLRASHRALDPDRSLESVPWHTHLEKDIAPIAGIADLTVEIFPVAHPFRAGSRIRLSVDTPGGSRPEWAFDVLDSTDPVTVVSGALRLPMVAEVAFPDGYPACSPGLRSQPCRLDP